MVAAAIEPTVTAKVSGLQPREDIISKLVAHNVDRVAKPTVQTAAV